MMGFLKMIGAVSAEEHAKLDAKFKTAIKDLAAMTAERDDRDAVIKGHADAIRQKSVTPDERAELARLRNEVRGLVDDVAAAEKVADERARQIGELNNEISALRPLAAAQQRRLENDRNRVRPSRSKKADAPVASKPSPKGKAPAKKAAR